MSLSTAYRPTCLDDVYGNDAEIEKLESVLNREEDKPHTFLFKGSRGCGKTSLARIAAKMVGCHEADILEMDVATNRGIDSAKELKSSVMYRPLHGKSKAYILDECFASTTKIKTISGLKEIQNIKVGEKVYNLNGESEVEKVFINKVSLKRVVKLKFNNQQSVYCSKEHLFLTSKGYKKAVDLDKKDLLLKFDCSIMKDTNQQSKGIKNENSKKSLFKMWQNFQTNWKESKVLFSAMQRISKIQTYLYVLWSRFFIEKQKRMFLFPELCCEMEKRTTRVYRTNANKRVAGKLQRSAAEGQKSKSKKVSEIEQTAFKAHEKKQSFPQSFNSPKRNGNKKNQRNIAYLERQKRWEWSVYRTTNTTSLLTWVGNGVCYWFRQATKRISNKLQSRYWKSLLKIGDRNRWDQPQYEKGYAKRFKKDKKIKRTWLESIEIYKPGSNDKSFKSVITNKERNKGHVNFYDLQIKGHPSYFVNELAVHNCHQGTPAFFNALLKTLEEPPEHVYFFLCTTDPQKVLKTVLSRCMAFTVAPLNKDELFNLLVEVVEKEEADLTDDHLDLLVNASEGIPREALMMLDSVIDLDAGQIDKAITEIKTQEKLAIDLCRALLKGESWKSIATILKNLKEEEETVRRIVLGYMNTVLLGGGKGLDKASLTIEEFSKPFFNSGRAGLTNACYMATL